MGHTRLGAVPTTRKWEVVVRALAEPRRGAQGRREGILEETVAAVASRTLDAAEKGLDRHVNDPGLAIPFYFLTQVVLAARNTDWYERMGELGIHIAPDHTLFDLTTSLQTRLDHSLAQEHAASDVSEMAQRAAGEALSSLAAPNASTLFGNTGEELRQGIRRLSTRKGFSDLGQEYFGRFISHFLNFYISRVTATQLGKHAFVRLRDISAFNEALQLHCRQSAYIIRDFCGEWFSKTQFEKGIDLQNTSRFVAVAVKKLKAELQRQQPRR